MDRLLDTFADLVEGLRNIAEIEYDSPEIPLEESAPWQAALLIVAWHDALTKIANGESDPAGLAKKMIGLLQNDPYPDDTETLSEIDKLRALLKPRVI